MKKMKEKFLRKYRLPEATFLEFLSHMTEHHYSKGDIIVRTGERNSNLYLIREGIWRAHYLVDGTETSLWFVTAGEVVFSSWGYVNNEPSMATIESVNESSAYMISKADLEQLFSSSIQMANFGRRIFEQEIVNVDNSTIAYGIPNAKERYLALLEANPELLRDVPLKHLASFLYITPQSLSRIRAGLRKKQ